MDKWFYIYGIHVQIYSDIGQNFDNGILSQLYSMYSII